MAASVVIDDQQPQQVAQGNLRVIDFAFTAHTDGAVTVAATGNLSAPIAGKVERVAFSLGTSTGFTGTLVDAFGNSLASKAVTGTDETTCAKYTVGALHVTVASAGSEKTGTIRAYIRTK